MRKTLFNSAPHSHVSFRPIARPASRHLKPQSAFAQFTWQKTLTWLILLFGFFACLLFLAGRFFVITKVYCTLNETSTACTQSLYEATQQLVGQPFLFNNLGAKMNQLKSPQLNFQSVSYRKVLPGILFVNFNFSPAVYKLTLPNGNSFTFDQEGNFTLAPNTAEVLEIQILYQPTINALSQQQLDLVLAQKFAFLEYFSREKRSLWQQLVFRDLNNLEIVVQDNTFILDLFDLDDNLQKLFYLQKQWQPTTKGKTIDLRFKLPIVR